MMPDQFDLFRPIRPIEGAPTEPQSEYPFGPPIEVCLLFERLALQIHAQGFQRYSARAILHRIRWHYHIERGLRDFKCNNNWTPAMARWCMARHAATLAGFFELRASPHASDDED
jgi:hypothetical protein